MNMHSDVPDGRQLNGFPLEGIRVLDVTHAVAGPFCTMLLADAGAEVIKVEPPVTGESQRHTWGWIPIETGEPLTARYAYLSRGKKTITLNLKQLRVKRCSRNSLKRAT